MTMEDILVDWIFPLFLIAFLVMAFAAFVILLIWMMRDLLEDDD